MAEDEINELTPILRAPSPFLETQPDFISEFTVSPPPEVAEKGDALIKENEPSGIWPLLSMRAQDPKVERNLSTRRLAWLQKEQDWTDKMEAFLGNCCGGVPRRVVSTIGRFLSILYYMLISTYVMIPVLLANFMVWLCSADILNLHYGKFIQLVVITPGLVFCMCFTIAECYRRREVALKELAAFKATIITQVWEYRSLTRSSKEKQTRLEQIILKLCEEIAKYLPPSGSESLYTGIYHDFLRIHDVLLCVLSPEAASKRVKKMIEHFENLRNLKEYRTPYSLDGYARLLLYSLPVALGPYFAHGCLTETMDPDHDEDCTKFGQGYFWCTVYFVCLGALRFVQARVENPYESHDGITDFTVDINEEMEEILKLAGEFTYRFTRKNQKKSKTIHGIPEGANALKTI